MNRLHALPSSSLWVLLLSLCCTGCGNHGGPRPTGIAARATDSGAPGTKSDAAPRDAASDPRTAEQSDAAARPGAAAARDAGARDAGTTDPSSPGDASTASATLRATVCGETTSFPSPLPGDTGMRTAQLVGSMRFGFVEGPVWVAELGVLLFSDMNFSGGNAKGPPSRIRRLAPPSTFDVFVESANSNGLALSLDGALLAATHDTQSLSAFDVRTGARSDLSIRYQDKHFRSPNDLTVRDDGTVYFTDPDYQLGSRTAELQSAGVYRVAPPLAGGTRAAELVDGTLQQPNGVALSPDQRTLYLGSSGNEIWKFSVAADGSVSGRSTFAEVGGSDGMTVDCAGNLYVASGTIEVFAPDGSKLGDIRTAENPSNAAFGGADRKTLYITAQTGLYSIALAVPGFPY